MIAYNHHIKFIPKLQNDKKVNSKFMDVITVKENSNLAVEEKFIYELIFYNNQGREITLYTDRKFARTKKEQFWAFEVKDVVTFYWYSGTLKLEYIKHNSFTEELLVYWCLHIILPIFFTIEETFNFLHACAFEIEGNSILFTAKSHGGKSTLANFFIEKGHTLISDDKVGIYEHNKEFFSVPSHPHHRPYRKMEDLGFFIKNFATETKLINAIFELEKADKHADIIIIELKGTEKFKTLRDASEINLFFQTSIRFNTLIEMSNIISVFKITVPWDINRLEEVYNAILEYTKGIKKVIK